MKNLFSVIILFTLFSFAAFAQKTTPTLPPAVEKETDVVKISTALIQIDVTVTDKKGNPVTDLKPEELEIFENGEKQDITNFSYISLTPQNLPVGEAMKLKNKSSVPLPPVKLRPEQARRTYALLVDDLGLSFASSYWVKSSLKKFVNEQMQEGDLVAILRVSGESALCRLSLRINGS